MDDNQKTYYINPVIAVAVVLELVFIIFAVVAIHTVLDRSVGAPGIKISNYSAIPDGVVVNKNGASNNASFDFDINENTKKVIEASIYNVADINNDGSMPNNGAKIREGSAYYTYVEDLDVYFLNFIVDIERLGQSYRSAIRWSNGSTSQGIVESVKPMVFCLHEDELIYGDFDCKDEYDGRGLDIIAYDLLRYRMFSNFTVGLSNVYGDGPLQININVNSDNDATKEAAIREVAEYLSILGFDLDDFDYKVVFLETAR